MPPINNNNLPIALKSLSIRDFRGIDHLELDFRSPDGLPNNLIVLAGPNGCGKTAVLEAALIAAGGAHLATGRRGKSAVRNGTESYSIQAVFENHLFGPSEVLVASEIAPPKPSKNIPFWYFSSWRAPTLVGPVGVTVGRPGRRPEKNDQNRLLNVKQLLANAAAIELFRPGQKIFNADYARWTEQINKYWKIFNPDGGQFLVDLTDSKEPGSGPFDVFLRLSNGSLLEVDILSAGQIELFLFLSALILNDDRHGIVFIDEPELHLDPQWHALIVRSLMELQPKAQFIVATHSPEIYDAAMSYERHFLVSEEDPRANIWGRADMRA
jgi:DNA repair ATPase RecN